MVKDDFPGPESEPSPGDLAYALHVIRTITASAKYSSESLLKEIHKVADESLKTAGNVTLGVGDGSGQHFVTGPYDTIKLLQAKLLRYEAIESGLRRAIGVLNSIPDRKVLHEGKKLYEIIPELEKLFVYKLKDIEEKTFKESSLRLAKNSQYGKFSDEEIIVFQIYYDGKEFRAILPEMPLQTTTSDYPKFLPHQAMNLKWEALSQKKGPIPIGTHSLNPPIKVVKRGEFVAFKGVIQIEANEDGIEIS